MMENTQQVYAIAKTMVNRFYSGF